MTESAEFRLCVECCSGNFEPCDDSVPGIGRLDWPKFVGLARYHRVQGLVWNSLRRCSGSIPADAADALCEDARDISAQSLRKAAECRTLLERFGAANVPLLILKGLPLGGLAYSNPALKSAIDIDLLIDPADLGRAAGLLREHGYRLIAPRDSDDDRALHAWHRPWKESVWAKDSPRLQIDLHTRTSDSPRLIPSIDVHSPRQWVEVAQEIRLPTLADEELFAYLSVHGASSGWFRLKWIADFAGLLHVRPPVEIERLYRRSQQLGAGRAAGQALLLADRLFGTLKGAPPLRAQLGRDAATRRLERASLRLLLSGPSEPTDRLFGTLPIHLTQFDLLPGLGYKLSELTRQVQRLFVRQAA